MAVLSVVILATTLYALWRVFRNYLVAHPMDNLPGPPPSSFLFGMYRGQPLSTDVPVLNFYVVFR